MGATEIQTFLDFLAVECHVAASTQNQALAAILFLYHHVILKEIGFLKPVHAKRPERRPIVLTRDEVRTILDRMAGVSRVVATLLYGGGLRLAEAISVRVKDIDFGYRQVTVRDGKGRKDRVTTLPSSLKDVLTVQLKRVQVLHQKDLSSGAGRVWLPDALAAKYANADREWGWQFVFPASRRHYDPTAQIERRHHVHESVIQKAMKAAVQGTDIGKPAPPHTFRPQLCHASARRRVRHQNGARTARPL